jgi:uncharacterized tellurite resistance protein B-like protein
MFEKLLSFLKNLPKADLPDGRPAPDDPRVAAAALLFHVVNADGEHGDKERETVERVMTEAYDIGEGELPGIISAAEEAEREAVDLYGFTSVLKRNLDEEARTEFIGLLWEVVYADGELHEVEDNIVWRVAELIGVDSRTRVTMRQRVQQAAGIESSGE